MIFLILGLIIIGIVALYFYMTQSRKLPDRGKWLIEYNYAHRGLHDNENPENTLGAFENAVNNNYAIELDVQLSKDDKIMVFHDNNLKRLTGVNGKVKDYTTEELGAFKINNTNFGIPLLSNVLQLVNDKVPLLIETKNEGFAGELEVSLYEILKDYKGKYAVQSFSPFSISWFKKNAPDVIRGQLASDFKEPEKNKPKIFYFSLKHLIINFISRPQFISYDKSGIEAGIIRRLRKFGTGVLCWTIKNKNEQAHVEPYTNSIIFENFEPSSKN